MYNDNKGNDMKPTYQNQAPPAVAIVHVTPNRRETLTSWISRMIVDVMIEVRETQEAAKVAPAGAEGEGQTERH